MRTIGMYSYNLIFTVSSLISELYYPIRVATDLFLFSSVQMYISNQYPLKFLVEQQDKERLFVVLQGGGRHRGAK